MKTLIIAGLLLLSLLACKDRNQDANVLPEATQSGKNTGGAIVDGKVWVAKIENPNLDSGGINATMYNHVNGEWRMQIALRNVENPSGSRIRINVISNNNFVLGDYLLYDSDYNRGYYYNSPTSYFTGNDLTGILTITKFDKANFIVSGTFNFTAKNSNGEIVTITEGRFDKKFIN